MEGDLATVLDIVLASRRIVRFVAGYDTRRGSWRPREKAVVGKWLAS
jgi:hypothetical protein